jgi:hypothetical protein
MAKVGLVLLLALGGCATASSGGQRLTGYPYDVHDEGGRVDGLVCGLSVDYTVGRSGGGTSLSGFDGSHQPVYLEVKQQGDERRIVGSLGSHTGTGEVDLTVSPQRIKGRAGMRDLDLVAVGDGYRGTMTVLGFQGRVDMSVDGRSELLKLSPSQLGGILPTLLNCGTPPNRPTVRDTVAVRVGGAPGYETRAANETK